MTKFPWPEFMQMGLGILKLSPTEFWRSTPREISAAFGSPPKPTQSKVLRQSLDTMMKRFPDLHHESPPSASRPPPP
jgi:uncharacterized phage protein (TIGR02216 family)